MLFFIVSAEGILFQPDGGKGSRDVGAVPSAPPLPPKSTRGPVSPRNIDAPYRVPSGTVGSLQPPCVHRSLGNLSGMGLDPNCCVSALGSDNGMSSYAGFFPLKSSLLFPFKSALKKIQKR